MRNEDLNAVTPERLETVKHNLRGGTRGHLSYGDVADTVGDEAAAIAGLTHLLRSAQSPKLRTIYLPGTPNVHVAVVFDGPDGERNACRIATALNAAERLIEELERYRRVAAAAQEALLLGAHDGPCDNEADRSASCQAHVAASRRRLTALRDALRDVEAPPAATESGAA